MPTPQLPPNRPWRQPPGLAFLDPPCAYAELAALLRTHAEELSGDVFDVLMGMGDYNEFVSLMKSYAEQVAFENSAAAGEGGSGLAPTVTSLQ